MPPDRAHYEAFAAVARTGHVTAAARALALPRPTVSRRVASLEEELGIALLHRTTRRITLTQAGQRLAERLQPLLDELNAMEQELREEAGQIQGTVRVSVLPLLAASFGPIWAHLRRQHPQLTVEVVANVRLVDLRSEGFDVAIWAGDVRDPDLVHRKLTVGHVGLVASPAYLAAQPAPTSIEALAGHELIRGHSASGRPRAFWPLVDGGQVHVDGHLVSNDHALLRAAALAGQGIVLLADVDIADDLAAGRLVRVLPGLVGTDAAVWLILARRSLLPARVRALVDAVTARFTPT